MKSYSTTNVTFDPLTHKVVPKDAVVLDLYDDERVSLPKFLNEIMGWIRQGLVNNIAGGTGVLERIRDQIEEQTKPPRIPEPGKYAVVRDESGEDWFRAGANEYTSHEWVNTSSFETRDWDDIPGRLNLIRKGMGV